jgi:PAS domain S-box-containing protein
MILDLASEVRRRSWRSRLLRAVAALAIVGASTLVRLAADPFLGDQLAYFTYVAAVVLATRYTGTGGGVLSVVTSVFAANYFFVQPRHHLVPEGRDWAAIAATSCVSLLLVWIVTTRGTAEARLRKAAEATRRHAEELGAILDTVPAVILITRDVHGFWVDGNRLAAEIMGMPPGANLSKAVAERDQPSFRTMRGEQDIPSQELPVRAAVAKGSEIRGYEFDIVRPDGSRRTLLGNATPLRRADGSIRGAVGAFLDITERREMENSLRDANRLKDEFLATLSHELRTPLNAIVGWSEMLLRGRLTPPDVRRATESIYRNARIQGDLIADVLDVSRIVSGKIRLEPQPVDVPATLHNALESIRAAADAKGVCVVSEIGNLPFRVSGDSTRMQQVFWNLLSNAVKFTPAGGTVAVSLTVDEGAIAVRVRDTGIGIAADFLPHVFERFRQLDSSSTRRHGGLGLGLAIVKHLVELHGGHVRVESEGQGKGATFTVTLPAHPFEERRRGERVIARHVVPVAPVPDEAPSLCGTRVLVVDDQRDARELSASVLRSHGATVAVAAGGAQALDQFTLFDPHVLLVDLAMPDMDGYALIDRIRKASGQQGRRVPAIAFTAYAREEDQRRALAGGFQLHVAKPVDSCTLVRAVAAVRLNAA